MCSAAIDIFRTTRGGHDSMCTPLSHKAIFGIDLAAQHEEQLLSQCFLKIVLIVTNNRNRLFSSKWKVLLRNCSQIHRYMFLLDLLYCKPLTYVISLLLWIDENTRIIADQSFESGHVGRRWPSTSPLASSRCNVVVNKMFIVGRNFPRQRTAVFCGGNGRTGDKMGSYYQYYRYYRVCFLREMWH